MKKIFRFLSSIHFAIILITLVTLFVIGGTFIESFTGSHRYAAYFTYNNPFFLALLWGFFVNILFSALRRWPFRIKHIPFLITHLGLLMVLGGALLKSYYGTQGSLAISEGASSQLIYLSDTFALRLEKRDENEQKDVVDYIKIEKPYARNLTLNEELFPKLGIQLIDHYPHAIESKETWFKGDFLYLAGNPPVPVVEIENDDYSKLSKGVPFSSWNLAAYKNDDIEGLSKAIYLDGLYVVIKDTYEGRIIYEGLLSHILKDTLQIPSGSIEAKLVFPFSPISGLESPELSICYTPLFLSAEWIKIPLDGTQSLINGNNKAAYFGNPSISVDLHRANTLAFIQDSQGDTFLFSLGQHGQVECQPFLHNEQNQLMAYNGGYGGYAIEAHLQSPSTFKSRTNKQDALKMHLQEQLRLAVESSKQLSPPLALLKTTCELGDIDFPKVCIEFLDTWNNASGWLFPENRFLPDSLAEVLKTIDWDTLSSHEINACIWTSIIFDQIEYGLREGKAIADVLKERNWPLTKHINGQSGDAADLLYKVTEQLFALGDKLPDPPPNYISQFHNVPGRLCRMLSAYFRAYHLHLNTIVSTDLYSEVERPLKDFCIECALTTVHKKVIPSSKWEDNCPLITLLLRDGYSNDILKLGYDQFGHGLKWPALGNYLLRFQPFFTKIPYRVRLRQARQINYTNSNQPYSFEADLIITDTRDGSTVEKTISMNHVHETWDGYRFYLANMTSTGEGAIKRAQIVVNHDPAKYVLTYPGALLVSLGMMMLFWMRPYK